MFQDLIPFIVLFVIVFFIIYSVIVALYKRNIRKRIAEQKRIARNKLGYKLPADARERIKNKLLEENERMRKNNDERPE